MSDRNDPNWEEILDNYSKALEENPELSLEDTNNLFPQFEGNEDTISRAKEYYNQTTKRGYGMSKDEKKELFPDFFDIETFSENNKVLENRINQNQEDPDLNNQIVPEPKKRNYDVDAALEAFRDSKDDSDIFSYVSNYLNLTGKSSEAGRLRGMMDSDQTTDTKRFETISTHLSDVYDNLEKSEKELENSMPSSEIESYYKIREDLDPKLEQLNNLAQIIRYNDQGFSQDELKESFAKYKELDEETRELRQRVSDYEKLPRFGKYLEIQKTKSFLHKQGLGYFKSYKEKADQEFKEANEVQLIADQGGEFQGDDGITRTLGRAGRRIVNWSTGLVQSLDDLMGGDDEYGVTDYVADWAENNINPDNSLDPNVRTTTQEKRQQFEDFVEKDGVHYLLDDDNNLLGVRKSDITALSVDEQEKAISNWEQGQIDVSKKEDNYFSGTTLARQTADAGIDLLIDLYGGKLIAKGITKVAGVTPFIKNTAMGTSFKKKMSEKLYKKAVLGQTINNRIGFSAMITARTQSEFYDQAVDILGEEHRGVAAEYALAQGLTMGLVNQINPMTYLMGGHRAISKVALDRVGNQIIFNETKKGAIKESTNLLLKNGLFLGSQGVLEGVEEMTESFAETNIVNKIFNRKIKGLNKFEESTLRKTYANDFMIGALLGIAGASGGVKSRSDFQNEIMFQAATSKNREKILEQVRNYDETGPALADKFEGIFKQYDEIVNSSKNLGIKMNQGDSLAALSVMEEINQLDKLLENKSLPAAVRKRLEDSRNVLNNRLETFIEIGKTPPPPPTSAEQTVLDAIENKVQPKNNKQSEVKPKSEPSQKKQDTPRSLQGKKAEYGPFRTEVEGDPSTQVDKEGQQVIGDYTVQFETYKDGSTVYKVLQDDKILEPEQNPFKQEENQITPKAKENKNIANRVSSILKGISKDIDLITDNNKVIDLLMKKFGYTRQEAEAEVKKSRGFSDEQSFVYVNLDKMSPSTPLHEFAHPWVAGLQLKRNDLYIKGLELVQDSVYMQRAIKQYGEGDSRLNNEALVLAIEDKGKQFLEGAEPNSSKKNIFKKWMDKFQKWVNTTFDNKEGKDFNDLTLQDFADIAVAEMGSGTKQVRVRQEKNGDMFLTTFVEPSGVNYTVVHPETKSVPESTKSSKDIFNDLFDFNETENKGVIIFGADSVGQGQSYKYPQSNFGWYVGLSDKESSIKSMTTRLKNAVQKGYNKVAIYVYPKVANAMFVNPLFHKRLEQELVDKYGDVLGKYYKDQFVNWQIEKNTYWTSEDAKKRHDVLAEKKRKLKKNKIDNAKRKLYTAEQENLIQEHKISVRTVNKEQNYKGINIDKMALTIAEPDVIQNKGKIVGLATISSIKNRNDRDRYHGSYNVQIDFSDVKYFYNPVSLSDVVNPLNMISKNKGYPITGKTADNMIQGYNLMLNHEGNPSVEMLYNMPGETVQYQSPEQIGGSPSALVSTNPGHEVRMIDNERSYAFKDLGIETTIDEKSLYNERVLDAITNVAGKVKILDRLGIEHTVTRNIGYWNELEPSFQITVNSKDTDVNKLVANILGHGFMQDAAISSYNVYKDGSSNPHGLLLQSPDPSVEISQEIIDKFIKNKIPFSINQDKNEITVYDNEFFEKESYSENDFDSYTSKIAGITGKSLKFVEVSQNSELFLNKDYEQNIETILLGGSTEASQEIQSIRDRLRSSGLTTASDISKAFNSLLHDNVEGVYQKFLEEKGVDPVSTPKLDLKKNLHFSRVDGNESLDPYVVELVDEFKGKISNEKLAEAISKKTGADKDAILSYLKQSPNQNPVPENQPSEIPPNPENQTDSVKKVLRGVNTYLGEDSVIGNVKNWLKKNAKKWLSVYGILPESLYKARERKANSMKAIANTVKQTSKRVLSKIESVKEDETRLKLEGLMSQALATDLTSKEGISILKELDKILPGISEEVVIMRTQIRSMSQTLIDEGHIKAGTVQTVERNLETYLNRSYKLYTDSDYKRDDISEDVMNAARNYLFNRNAKQLAKKMLGNFIGSKEAVAKKLQEIINENPAIQEEASRLAEQDITDILNKSEENPFIMNTSSLGKNMDIFKRRMSESQLPESIRALMGEYTDPLTQYAQTVFKLSKFIEQSRYLEFMKKDGLGKYLFEKIPIGQEGMFTKVSADTSPSFKPINGLYMPNELHTELVQRLEGLTGPFWENYLGLMGWVKWGKTIGSLPTHIKNVYGNLGFMWMNGLMSGSAYKESFKLVKNQMKSMPDSELIQVIERMVKEGIVNQSAALGEVRRMIEGDKTLEQMIDDAGKKKWKKTNLLKKGFKKYVDVSNDLYQLEDDFFKITAYMTERSRHSKALFEQSYESLDDSKKKEIDDIVFEKVRNTLPNYSRVPKAIQFLRISPLLGNFVSFQSESIRTMYHTYNYIKEEINSDNPGIKSIGYKRLAGLISYGVGKTAFLGALGSGAGIGIGGILGMLQDDEDEKNKKKALRDFVTPWSKRSDIILNDEGNGNYTYYDFSSSDPHGYFRSVLNMVAEEDFTEDNILSAVFKILAETVQPFTEVEITARGAGGLLFNKDSRDKDIFNPEASLSDQVVDVLEYIYDWVKPGNIAVIERTLEAENKNQRFDEIQTAFTGARPNRLNIEESFMFKTYNYKKRLGNSKKLKNDDYEDSVKQTTRILKEFHESYKNALILGATEKQLNIKLKNAGLSKKERYAVKTGIVLDNIVRKPE